jgi:ribonuclease HII
MQSNPLALEFKDKMTSYITRSKTQSKIVETALRAMTAEQKVKMTKALMSNNGDHKVDNVSEILFASIFAKINKCRDELMSCTLAGPRRAGGS